MDTKEISLNVTLEISELELLIDCLDDFHPGKNMSADLAGLALKHAQGGTRREDLKAAVKEELEAIQDKHERAAENAVLLRARLIQARRTLKNMQ